MFGKDYHYEKQPKVLADGDYEVILESPFETKVGNYSVLRFPFKVKGENEPVVPNYFDLFDCADPYDNFKLSQFRKSASKIKACFKLPGDFSSENYAKWVGNEGKIRIEKSENGFTNVTRFYKAEMTKEEEATL
ncbi:MAG: hypothetical protein U0L20_09460 [Ruminococcus sp.]|nr:hypothetical protein [Ruminococcus sp.]